MTTAWRCAPQSPGFLILSAGVLMCGCDSDGEGEICGNGTCGAGENVANCPADCEQTSSTGGTGGAAGAGGTAGGGGTGGGTGGGGGGAIPGELGGSCGADQPCGPGLLCGSDNLCQLDPALDYAAFFDQAWNDSGTYGGRNVTDGHANESCPCDQSIYYFYWDYAGLVDAWRATGQKSYLDEALGYAYVYKDKSSVITNSGGTFYGWPADSGETAGIVLWEAYGFRPIFTLLRVMHGSPNLLATAHGQDEFPGTTYQDVLDDLFPWFKVNFFDKWEADGIGNHYRSRVHMASHSARIALDIYLINGESKYLQYFQNIAHLGFPGGTSYPGDSWRNNLNNSPSSTTYVWNATWDIDVNNNNGDSVQDQSHGSDPISFAVEAFEAGHHFTQADIDAFSNTLLNNVWVDNGSDPYVGFNEFVDGSDTASTTLEYEGRFMGGWGTLARYNDAAWARVCSEVTSVDRIWLNLRGYTFGTLAYAQAVQNRTVAYPENF